MSIIDATPEQVDAYVQEREAERMGDGSGTYAQPRTAPPHTDVEATHRIPQELDNLDHAIAVLESALDTLYNRLGPVRGMVPTPATDKKEMETTDNVGSRIAGSVQAIQHLENDVRQIIEELEI